MGALGACSNPHLPNTRLPTANFCLKKYFPILLYKIKLRMRLYRFPILSDGLQMLNFNMSGVFMHCALLLTDPYCYFDSEIMMR